MIANLIILLVGGIGFAQAVSDPQQVTLRWLRLGGLTSVALLAAAVTLTVMSAGASAAQPLVAPCVFAVAQLMLVQLGLRFAQRVAAALLWFTVAYLGEMADIVTLLTASALLGGYLMAMLLGHAYLTAGNEMTQSPFARLVKIMLAVLLLRAALSAAFAALPYFNEVHERTQSWNLIMITARYAVGIVVPLIFTFMTLECINRKANQSATGILYVAGVLIILGEGAALALIDATGHPF